MAIPRIWAPQEIQRLREEFKEIDKDRNGLIDKGELEALLKGHFGEYVDKDEVAAAMPVLGTADTIVFEEFVHYLTTDVSVRFDVRFIRHQRQQWEDRLGLQVYIPFLLLFLFYLLSIGVLGPGFWQTFSLNDLNMGEEFDTTPEMRFEKFYHEIKDEAEFWQWVEGPMVKSMWGEDDAVSAHAKVQFANMPVGAVRFRQVRSTPRSCRAREKFYRNHVNEANGLSDVVGDGGLTVLQSLANFAPRCYPEFDGHKQWKGPYYTAMGTTTDRPFDDASLTFTELNTTRVDPAAAALVGEAYAHRGCANHTRATQVTTSFMGKVGTYGCDGYYLVVPFSWTRGKVLQALAVLKNGIPYTTDEVVNGTVVQTTKKLKWIDLQTRAIAVEWHAYNQNQNLFSKLQYFVEVSAGGAWVAVFHNINYTLFQWSNNQFAYYWFMFTFFFLICTYLLVWSFKVWRAASARMYDHRTKGIVARATALVITLCRSFWFLFDLVNYTFFFTVWGLRFVQISYGMGKEAVLQQNMYPADYDTIASSTQITNYLDGINALLCVIRVLYYLRLNPRFNVLVKTLETSSKELVGILFIFAVLFLGFCVMGYMVFGQVVENFRDIPNVATTLLRYLVGDFNYVQIREERRIMAPLFFTFFQAMCFFVLLNMVIAVLSDSFAAVQEGRWRPALLFSLMANTSEAKYEPVKGQRGNVLTECAIVREISYWVKMVVLWGQNAVRMGDPHWEAEYERLRQSAIDSNPRLYWEQQETRICEQKSVVPFRDRLNLCLLSLDDYLFFGSEGAETFEGFGHDLEPVVQRFVVEAAEAMELEPRDLLVAMMESHHYWYRHARAVAQFGDPELRYEEDEVKKEVIAGMASRRAAAAAGAGSDDEDSDDASDGEGSVISASSSALEGPMDEQREDDKVREEGRRRLDEQEKVMGEVLRSAGQISSKKRQIQAVMTQAVVSGLRSRLARQERLARFEQGGAAAGLRVHRLVAARYGRYVDPATLATDTLPVLVRRPPRTVLEGGVRPGGVTIELPPKEYSVRRFACPADTLMEVKELLGIPRSQGVVVKPSASGGGGGGGATPLTPFDYGAASALQQIAGRGAAPVVYDVAEADAPVVDWAAAAATLPVVSATAGGEGGGGGGGGGGAAGGGAAAAAAAAAEAQQQKHQRTRVWRETMPEDEVFAAVQEHLAKNGGRLRTTVDGLFGAAGEMLDQVTNVSTENEYEASVVEVEDVLSQLELVYEPVTLFREHMETTMHEMIRKRLPNIMLETFTTQQLMALLESKVKVRRNPLDKLANGGGGSSRAGSRRSHRTGGSSERSGGRRSARRREEEAASAAEAVEAQAEVTMDAPED